MRYVALHLLTHHPLCTSSHITLAQIDVRPLIVRSLSCLDIHVESKYSQLHYETLINTVQHRLCIMDYGVDLTGKSVRNGDFHNNSPEACSSWNTDIKLMIFTQAMLLELSFPNLFRNPNSVQYWSNPRLFSRGCVFGAPIISHFLRDP